MRGRERGRERVRVRVRGRGESERKERGRERVCVTLSHFLAYLEEKKSLTSLLLLPSFLRSSLRRRRGEKKFKRRKVRTLCQSDYLDSDIIYIIVYLLYSSKVHNYLCWGYKTDLHAILTKGSRDLCHELFHIQLYVSS